MARCLTNLAQSAPFFVLALWCMGGWRWGRGARGHQGKFSQMFIVRVVYETGQQIELGFDAHEAAAAAKQRIDGADIKKRLIVQDDHGHDVTLRVDGIVYVALVDFARQVEAALSAELEASRLRGVMFAGSASLNSFDQRGVQMEQEQVPAPRQRNAFAM